MAHPDLDDGWFKLAYELLPALLTGGFRREAAIVLCEILAQTYGRGKHATATIEPAKIAARSRRSRANVWRGIRELLEDRVIERRDDGTYKFIKDYAKWGSNKGPLIDTHLQQYCASYPILAKSYEPKEVVDSTVSQVDTPSAYLNGSSVSYADTASENANGLSVSQVDTPRVSQVDTLSATPPTTPPVGGRLENSLKTNPKPQGGEGVGTKTGKPVSIKDLIDEAKALHGDGVARQVLAGSQEILGTFGAERLDCYLAAIREATETKATINQPHRWFLKVGKEFLAGTRAPKAQIAPRKSEGFNAAVENLLDDPAFNEFCDRYEGA